MTRGNGGKAIHDRSNSRLRPARPELESLLDRLDEAPRHARASMRSAARHPYRRPFNLVVVTEERSQEFEVMGREIGEGGISFVNGAFLHPGQHCIFRLVSRTGDVVEHRGEIAGCSYVEAFVHHCRARFDTEIDPSDYCAEAEPLRLLLVEPDDGLFAIAAHFLGQVNATITRATDTASALAAAKGRFDGAMIALRFTDDAGGELLAALRKTGAFGFVAAIADGEAAAAEVATTGFDHVLAEPLSLGAIRGMLVAGAGERIRSRLRGEPDLAPLIDEFVTGLPAAVAALESALESGDLKRLELLARTMKGGAGSYGFDPVSLTAEKLEEAAAEGDASIEQARAVLGELAGLCRRVRGVRDPGKTKGAAASPAEPSASSAPTEPDAPDGEAPQGDAPQGDAPDAAAEPAPSSEPTAPAEPNASPE